MFLPDNLTTDGPTSLSFTENVGKRYEAYGWHVVSVEDVANGLDDLRAAIAQSQAVEDKLSLIKIKTVIANGSQREGSEKTHGAPLGSEDIAFVKKRFGLDPNKIF